MKLEKILVKDIDARHLNDGCFHLLSTIKNSEYLQNTFLIIGEDRKLFGTSYSVYKSMLEKGIEQAYALIVADTYYEKFDLYLQNITTNVTFLYHKIKKNYPEADKVKNCEFDNNQLDLLYYIDLDAGESMELRFIEEETAKIKKNFDVTIVLKTLEHNYLIQKFFNTNLNEITFEEFNNRVNDTNDILHSFLSEKHEDDFFRQKTYPEFVIKSDTIEKMNAVLSFFKINKDKIKTTRLNFKKIESIIS
jgi:hypothetical protein